jgi:DNA-binding HxlR family transcriptional regulator
VEIPGVSVTNFIRTATTKRVRQTAEDMPANEMLKVLREKSELLEIDRKFLSRSLNEGFLVEKKNVMKYSNGDVGTKIGYSVTKPILDLISMHYDCGQWR